MKDTKLICPCCGAEFKISEKEHLAAGVAIGEDSGLGTVKMPLKSPGRMTAGERLAALKAAGFDTSGLYALKSAAGDESLVRMDGNGITKLSDDDPVLKAILASGTVPEKRLFRRWIAAQIFRILQSSAPENYEKDFKAAVQRRGAKYMWEMTVEEFRVQKTIAKNDAEAYGERRLFFSRSVAARMAEHYLSQLRRRMKRSEKLLAGEPAREGERIISVSDETCDKLAAIAASIRKAATPKALYNGVKKFKEIRPELKDETICPAWLDAFRGAGAYFTLKNLILFSGLQYGSNKGEQAARALYVHAKYLVQKGLKYELFPEMLHTFNANGLNIREKRAEWARTTALRKYMQTGGAPAGPDGE